MAARQQEGNYKIHGRRLGEAGQKGHVSIAPLLPRLDMPRGPCGPLIGIDLICELQPRY